MSKHLFRGHLVYIDSEGISRYCDNDDPTVETHEFRPCGFCGLFNTREGHDGCLGTLPERIVMNACCGHGDANQAYIQYWNKSVIKGIEAIEQQKLLKKQREPKKVESILRIDKGARNSVVRFLVQEGMISLPPGIRYNDEQAHKMITIDHLRFILSNDVDKMRFIGKMAVARIQNFLDRYAQDHNHIG